MNRAADERPVFVLRLRPEKNIDPIRALRNVLKRLLRNHGMRAVSVEEEKPDGTA
jgi:hypothetical protein